MKDIICSDCGKELVEVYELDISEKNDLDLINVKQQTVNRTRNETDLSNFTDEQLMEFFIAVSNFQAEVNFLDYKLGKKLREKVGDFHTIIDYKIYKEK